MPLSAFYLSLSVPGHLHSGVLAVLGRGGQCLRKLFAVDHWRAERMPIEAPFRADHAILHYGFACYPPYP